jgi:hypothetical protein
MERQMETFLDRAMALARRGIPVVPVRPREKAAMHSGWPELATTDGAQIVRWHNENPDYNVGAVAKAVLGSVWILDCDSEGLKERIESELGFKLPATFTVRSKNGLHLYWRQTPESIALGNVPSSALKEDHLCDVQVHNKYVVGAGSVHPSGILYTVVDHSEIVAAPIELLNWIRSMKRDQRQHEVKMAPKTLIELVKRDAGLQPYINRIDAFTESDVKTNFQCPLHDPEDSRSHRSFAVFYPAGAFYPVHKCHHNGCLASGDSLAFVQQFEGCDFPTAYRAVLRETYDAKEPEAIQPDRKLILWVAAEVGGDSDKIIREIQDRYPEHYDAREASRGEDYWRFSVGEYVGDNKAF